MKFVYNEKGFLLLEHLIAIAIMGIISIGFLGIMQVISGYAVNQNALTMHEANTVAIRIQNEVRFADFLTASSGQLDAHFSSSNEIVSFFILNNRLVRRVNGRGGEILVYNVDHFDVVAFDSYGVWIGLRCSTGNAFSFYLRVLQLNINFTDSGEEEITDEELEE